MRKCEHGYATKTQCPECILSRPKLAVEMTADDLRQHMDGGLPVYCCSATWKQDGEQLHSDIEEISQDGREWRKEEFRVVHQNTIFGPDYVRNYYAANCK